MHPLVETNGELAISILQGWHAKFEKLDPNNGDAATESQSYLLEDVKRVFGPESPEASQVWENGLVPARLLPWAEEDVDPYGPGLLHRSNAEKMKSQIDKMCDRIGRLVDRAKELAERHGALRADQGGDVNPFDHLPHEDFHLIKPGGERRSARGIWDKSSVIVFDRTFPVAPGDAIERTLPNGSVMRYDVVDPGFQKGVSGAIPDHYNIKLRSSSTLPKPVPPQVVHHDNSTNYHIHGSTIGAVGENATVASSQITGQATQWNVAERDAVAAEISKLRKELVGIAGGDGADAEQATEELVHVNAANKAIAANDVGAFKGAMKKLGGFGVKVLERVVTTATLAWLQAQGVLPAAPHHGALPPGGE